MFLFGSRYSFQVLSHASTHWDLTAGVSPVGYPSCFLGCLCFTIPPVVPSVSTAEGYMLFIFVHIVHSISYCALTDSPYVRMFIRVSLALNSTAAVSYCRISKTRCVGRQREPVLCRYTEDDKDSLKQLWSLPKLKSPSVFAYPCDMRCLFCGGKTSVPSCVV